MPVLTDQLGRNMDLPHLPRRIISLVPSITELLYSLQLEQEVVGITKFCVHPASWFRQKTRVGGTKNVHFDTVHELKPDLILANKEENVKEQIEELAQHYPVWVSDVNNLPDALQMIEQVGIITGKATPAASIASEIKSTFEQLQTTNHKLQTAYLIWRDPYMTIGGDTFINDMLDRCGLQNAFAHLTRYPVVTIEELQAAHCDLLLLSSEPYPFKQKHIDELQPLLPGTTILPADGEMFSWYGSRLLQAPAYFAGLLQQLPQIG